LRALESRYKYGVIGAGAVGASLIGLLPSRSRELGPVCGVSYRVASRTANTLRAGYPARAADELNRVDSVLFHSSPEHTGTLLELLETAQIEWKGKALVFCDCAVKRVVMERFQTRGASPAAARRFSLPGCMIVEGCDSAALSVVRRMARDLRMKVVEIAPGSADRFDAAVTLASAAITALIDQAAALLRNAGIRDIEAARIASLLFEQSARDYAHSGKQSWAWYMRKPELANLQAQLESAGPQLEPVLRHLLLFGFEAFHKHDEIGAGLTRSSAAPG
jgi:predicted short-subunit dehydrogenase-like oxidoreductase (DUF2520 family)